MNCFTLYSNWTFYKKLFASYLILVNNSFVSVTPEVLNSLNQIFSPWKTRNPAEFERYNIAVTSVYWP